MSPEVPLFLEKLAAHVARTAKAREAGANVIGVVKTFADVGLKSNFVLVRGHRRRAHPQFVRGRPRLDVYDDGLDVRRGGCQRLLI